MEVKEHVLLGCSFEYLIQYLKALGIFRLLATQKDSSIRANWKTGVFVLYTALEQDDITAFFLNEYKPSPIIAPWNGGSGFYGKSAEGNLKAIEESTVERLEIYRTTIKECRELLCELDIDKKPDDAKLKNEFRLKIRQRINDEALKVMDSLFMLQTDPTKPGSFDARFSSLLGSGGNDGNLEFTNTFMWYLGQVIEFGIENDKKKLKELSLSEDRLKAALFKNADARGTSKGAVGQFFPGGAGGVNLSVGYSGETLINPWDYILALEGILVFKGAVTRQLDVEISGKAAFPFAVAGTAAGFGNISQNDGGANIRAEIWLPIWEKPSSYKAISHVFAEGRAQVGRKKAKANSGLDFARAVASLGVDRGIGSFQRVGLISGDRFGKMNFAVNMGNFPVFYRKNIRLLDQIDDWLYRWRNFAGRKETPARYQSILKRMEDSVFRYSQFGKTEDLTAILIELGAAEESLKYLIEKDSPCSPLTLTKEWVDAADDGSTEYRIAASLASIKAESSVGSMREYFEPVERLMSGYYTWSKSNDVKMQGSSFEERLLYVLQRRLINADQNNLENWPLEGSFHADLRDINLFINDQVNMEKIESLFKGLLLVRWDSYQQKPNIYDETPLIDPTYAILKLNFLPDNLRVGGVEYKIGRESSIVTRVRSGDMTKAVEKSLRRLRASNLNTKLQPIFSSSFRIDRRKAVRIGAALLIPIGLPEITILTNSVIRKMEGV